MAHVQCGPAMHVSLSTWLSSLRAEATAGFPTHVGPSLRWVVSKRNQLRPLEECGWARVALLCLAPMYEAMCLHLGDPLSPLSGPLLFLFSSVSPFLPPPAPQFSLATSTSTCMTFQLRFLKVLRELIGCQLAKGRVDRDLGGLWCTRFRPAMGLPECSSSAPVLGHLPSSVESKPSQERLAGNSGFGWLQSQPPQAAPEPLETASLHLKVSGLVTRASAQAPEAQTGVESRDQSGPAGG